MGTIWILQSREGVCLRTYWRPIAHCKRQWMKPRYNNLSFVPPNSVRQTKNTKRIYTNNLNIDEGGHQTQDGKS